MNARRKRTWQRTIVALLFCHVAASASAQENVIHAFYKFVESKHVEVTKSFSEERDIKQENHPIIAKADVYTFTIKANRKKLIDEVLAAFEKDRNNENVYLVLNHTGGRGIPTNGRQLLVGEDTKNAVYIGMNEMENWQLLCLLDPTDETRSHRYAYAIEWNEHPDMSVGGVIRGKLVVTYSRIPENVLSSQQSAAPHNYNAQVEYNNQDIASEVMRLVLNGSFDTSNSALLLTAFNALKSEYSKCKTEEMASKTGTMLVMSIYTLCDALGKKMKASPESDNPDLRKLLRSELDDLIRFTNHSSDVGRSHRGYLELAQKALE